MTLGERCFGERLTDPAPIITRRGFTFSFRFDDVVLAYIASGPIVPEGHLVRHGNRITVHSHSTNRDKALEDVLQQLADQGW